MTDSNKIEALKSDVKDDERRVCPGRLRMSELIYTLIGLAGLVGICTIVIVILVLKNMNKGVKSLNPKNWQFNAEAGVYYQVKVSYLYIPKDTKCQKMAIFIPKDYMDCKEEKKDKYSCKVKQDSKVGSYTPESAPIVVEAYAPYFAENEAILDFPTSKSAEIKKYADAGYIYVYPGLRGSKHGVPGGVVDLKSSIVYTKVQAKKKIIPGNYSRVFAFGLGGGAEEVTMAGITGDSEDYNYYLQLAGSITNITDSILGAAVWCPITNMDYGDEAYEWNMGKTRDSSYNSSISKSLAGIYGKYINAMEFYDDGTVLTLEDTDGYYQNGTYYEYVKTLIENSFNNFVQDKTFPLEIDGTTYNDVFEYIDALNKDIYFISFDNGTQKCNISDIESFAKVCKKATRGIGAYDDIDKKNVENQLFGLDGKYTHFDTNLGNVLGNKKKFEDEMADADSLGYTVQNRLNLYSPFYWLSSLYWGYNTTTVCKYWRIRSGLFQTEAPINSELNLYLGLKKFPGEHHIDFETVWGEGHVKAERTGEAEDNLITWITGVIENENK